MKIEIECICPDGGYYTKEVPARMEVCDRCDGQGSHTNPNIDGNGITAREMEELGPDFEAEYFAGNYDVRCEQCRGANVIKVPDVDSLDQETLADWNRCAQEKSDYEAERLAERRY